MEQFAKRLRELRREKNLTQKQLGKQLNVSQRSISSWETQFRQPSFEFLELLAKTFEVSADYLLGLEDWIN